MAYRPKLWWNVLWRTVSVASLLSTVCIKPSHYINIHQGLYRCVAFSLFSRVKWSTISNVFCRSIITMPHNCQNRFWTYVIHKKSETNTRRKPDCNLCNTLFKGSVPTGCALFSEVYYLGSNTENRNMSVVSRQSFTIFFKVVYIHTTFAFFISICVFGRYPSRFTPNTASRNVDITLVVSRQSSSSWLLLGYDLVITLSITLTWNYLLVDL